MPNAAPTHQGKQQAKPREGKKATDPFYMSVRWRGRDGKGGVRMAALRRDGFKCNECDTYCTRKGDAHVDHIEERKANPSRAFDIDNLQTLCAACHGRKTRRNARAD